MNMEKESDKTVQVSLTQSKYVLAKYGIQVIDSYVDPLQETFIPEGDRSEEVHYHPGPRAIEYKADAGKFSCDRDTWMRVLWCYLIPCTLMGHCFMYMCDCCCECLSTCLKRMEEQYTFQFCDRIKCCTVEES